MRHMDITLCDAVPRRQAFQMESQDTQPGDYILNRYIPDATPEKRQEARAALLRFGMTLVRWGERELARRDRDSQESPVQRKVEGSPPL